MKYLLLSFLILLGFNAQAQQTQKIDDSRTVVLSPTVPLKLDNVFDVSNNTLVGEMLVDVHLNVEPWKGKVGKIYLKLSDNNSLGWMVRWTTNGVLREGVLRNNDRALVYVGPITQSELTDRFQFVLNKKISMEERQKENLNFEFEIDFD